MELAEEIDNGLNDVATELNILIARLRAEGKEDLMEQLIRLRIDVRILQAGMVAELEG